MTQEILMSFITDVYVDHTASGANDGTGGEPDGVGGGGRLRCRFSWVFSIKTASSR